MCSFHLHWFGFIEYMKIILMDYLDQIDLSSALFKVL